MKKIEMILDAGMEGKPLEKLMREYMGLTQKQIRSAKFRDNGICLNGIRQRITALGKAGDWLSVCLEEEKKDTGKVVPVKGTLEILYEDEDIIAVNKPGGIPSHPGRGHYRDSLANLLAGYLKEKETCALLRPVGRLDRDTSGVMVFGKNRAAAARLFSQKEQGIFEKEYLALVRGKIRQKEGVIEAPIGNLPGHKLKMQVSEMGKPAFTRYMLQKEYGDYSLLRCRILTGRTHQIRVHLSWIGYPIVGDILYGNGEESLSRGLALHCEKAVFVQPFTGVEISVRAAVPDSFSVLYEKKREDKVTG